VNALAALDNASGRKGFRRESVWDVREAVMKNNEQRKSKAAEELEGDLEYRNNVRHLGERAEQEDLVQGMQTGTHGATHLGVKWGRSYRNLKKKARPKPAANNNKKNSRS
jgi:hypothetical protein